MRKHRIVALAALGLLGGIAAAGGARARAQDEFVHLQHKGLFPTCEGCHRVEPGGVTLPSPNSCAECHDGVTQRRVDWRPSPPRATNLDFNHAQHLDAIQQAMGVRLPCGACHTPRGAERMDVQRALVETCLGCHARGKAHYVEAPCGECHIPLTRATRFTREQIAEFPVPEDHGEDDFLLQRHGAAAQENLARCEVCHARELCSSCHVNAPSVPAIQKLPRDPRVAELAARREPKYPAPASHRAEDWWSTHRFAAKADVSQCAACHTRTSCETCHAGPAPPAVRRLPPAPAKPEADRDGTAQERGPGVRLKRSAPAFHTPTFDEDHRALAASAAAQCQVCHTRTECTSCHTGSEALNRPGDRVARYHPANFLQQHSAAAFSREVECASCHNPEAFCRSCHIDQGQHRDGRFDTGFHDRDPRFVFGHGQAARQGLESCATCHAQRDCLQCHSALGGRRVNPHGPGFDPDRLRSKNPALCLRCHRGSILEP